MMILMLLCAKTARTYGRTLFQYVDLTAPNVAAGKNGKRFTVHTNFTQQAPLHSGRMDYKSRLPIILI